MRRTVLKSKIHRATVTDTNLDYEGSLTIDSDLLDEADILPNEQIHVWDVTNGNRIVTYALAGPRGSGVVQVNGGGAHSIRKGDLIIIATFTTLRDKPARRYEPVVVFVDEKNHPRSRPGPADVAAGNGAAPEAEGANDQPASRPSRRRPRKAKSE
jgi:aspartate 1-decarboxylase